ncbi:MAG: carbohydrate ABC transporter permease [Lachnospiraceae bacterium]|jgi:multiple sugar transport system permease protein|nr:carbohydrate ABC transporter permease [Lachnospiraceae bacterium]MCI1727142.1 carbohydrate ABC transporter permease [Lachnospiraceae bacterium]
MAKSKKITAGKVLGFIGMIVFLVVIVFPFYWLIITALKDPKDISLMPTELWPSRWSFQFFINCFTEHHLQVYLENSIIVALGAMVVTIIIAFPAAYAFARLKFKFKKFWKNFILIANMFPIIAIVTPMFIIFKNLHLINTYAGLIVPSVIITLPMAIWTLISFINALPYDLEEAAQIDGCSRFQSVIKIIVPLAAPGVFTTAIIAFITAWNEFMFALILITKDQMRTVPVAISMFPGQYTVPWGDMAAASVIATIPIVIVVLLCQRKIVSGLTSGAVKG